MTNREFLEAVLNGNLDEDIMAFAKNELDKLNAKNEKRRNTPTKAQLENAPIKEAIIDYVTEHSNAVASEIATALNISTAKASALCGQLVTSEIFVAGDVKIKGKGIVKGYSLKA